jgi:hypothetical protein
MSRAEVLLYVESRPGLADAIAIAHAGNYEGLRSAEGAEEDAALSAAIFHYLRTGGMNMSKEDRQDYAEAVRSELITMPYNMVMEQLRLAPRSVRFPSELLPWIFSSIEKHWEGSKTRYKSLAAVVDLLEDKD